MQTRRHFLKQSLVGAAGLSAALRATTSPASAAAASHLDRLGVGLFTIPTSLDKDFAGTLKLLASIGYKEVEPFGPYPFSTQAAKDGWARTSQSLAFKGSGWFGHTVQDVKRMLDDNGLTAPSLHTDLDSLRKNMGPMADAAHAIGARYVVLPSIPAAERPNLDAFKRMADEFNQIGAAASKQGLRFGYHNHGYGLAPVDGKRPLEVLLDATDPSTVFLEMDIYWTVAGGADPAALFSKYKGRYTMVHIKDMAEKKRFAGDGGDSAQWIALFPFISDAGSGVLDLKGILSAAKASGVQHFFIERDQTPTPDQTLKSSYRFLSTLELTA